MYGESAYVVKTNKVAFGARGLSTSPNLRQSQLEFSENIDSGDDNEEITIHRNADRFDTERSGCGYES